jgi:cytochrome b561
MRVTMRPYSKLQISLHWLVALLVVAQFVFHDGIAGAWDGFLEGKPAGFNPLVMGHVVGGALILALVLWRVVIRKRQGPVAPVAGTSKMMAQVTHLGHLALYAVLVLMALSGSGAWFGEVERAAQVHSLLRFAVLALVAGHFAASLYHHFWLKDGLLRRMSFGK